jgi:hypothetical protein
MRQTIAALLLAGCFVGCVVTVEPVGAPYTELYVSSAPPPLRVEYPSAPPGSGYIWLSGYWAWSNGRWLWVSGHWVKARPGYVWVVPCYEYRGGRYIYVEGGWIPETKYRGTGYGGAKGSGGSGGYPAGGGKGYPAGDPKP